MDRESDQREESYGMNKAEHDQLAGTFRMEASELLAELEVSLLELEKSPENKEAVSSVFRAFHTLKGSGAMCGFDEVSRFTHHIETVYDLVRNGMILADNNLIDLTLAAGDLIKDLISSPEKIEKSVKDRESEILFSFSKLVAGTPDNGQMNRKLPESGTAASIPGDLSKQATYRIRFRPSPEIFLSGTNPLLLLNELRGLGECTIVAYTDTIPDLDSIDPGSCYTTWDVILTTDKGIDAIKDVFIFVEGESELQIKLIDDGEQAADTLDCGKLGRILVEKNDLSSEDLELALKDRKKIGEILVEKGFVKPESVTFALAEQDKIRQIREDRQKNEALSNIRVSSHKLDMLVNFVGELVTVQARLSQTSFNRTDPELVSIAEEVERLTGEIREITMGMRMLPVGTTFSTFKRLVRDLSKELGKEIDLITDGGETELDKTVIEKLHDPLMHLIRNSIDHGIEMPEERERKGKQRKGTVHLSAIHSGGQVLINIQDDGAGIDPEDVRARALETGLITQDVELSEKEIFSLIFTPGFTTAAKVTNVSGRGVGMDIVKRATEAVGGTVEINSRRGAGTTIILKLPLTLAIIEGLLVKTGSEYFVLPLSAVDECVELTAEDITKSHGRHIANVRGQIVPYIRLREKFIVEGTAPDREQIVIVASEGQRAGFVVDSVIGEHQTVIKSLGAMFRNIEGLSGATILGDGTVALIIDIAKLVKMFEREEVNMTAGLCAGNSFRREDR